MLFLWIVCLYLSRNINLCSSQRRSDCDALRSSVATVDVSPGDERISEIHVRHNLKGSVVIQTLYTPRNNIEMHVEKRAASEDLLNYITIEKNYFPSELSSDSILRLQLDYIGKVRPPSPPSPSVKPSYSSWWLIFIGTVAASVGMLVVIGVISIFIRHRMMLQAEYSQQQITDRLSDSADTSQTPSVGPQVTSAKNISQKSHRGTMLTFGLVTLTAVAFSQCLLEAPSASVVISIPQHMTLDVIKVYFKKQLHNQVFTSEWIQKNLTKLQIYDVTDVGHTMAPQCSVKSHCPDAYQQELVDCDPLDGACVCQRGYVFQGGICVDEDECSGPAVCYKGSICLNTIGSFHCHCPAGYYMKETSCHACKALCREGQYEMTPCSEISDRQCSDCVDCVIPSYQSSPCTRMHDTQCTHVAHPIETADDDPVSRSSEGVTSTTSANVFTDDLQVGRDLDMKHYVMSNGESIDFLWKRGDIRVFIAVENIRLLPVFTAVPHLSDTHFILSNRDLPRSRRMQFNAIVKNYCRHPIPDYYSLILKISRDRGTKARRVICDDKDSSLPSCPNGYVNGDVFVYRSLNEPCPKQGMFPEQLDKDKANSLVCLHANQLLTLFNQSAAPVHTERSSSRQCRQATESCDQCHNQCRQMDVFENTCCKIVCVNLSSCKHAMSRHCVHEDFQCAIGDAYDYTLQPVFHQTSKQHFQCHIRHQPTSALYQLSYYISVPSIGFEMPHRRRIVRLSDIGPDSTLKFDFLHIYHDAALHLLQNAILIGRESSALTGKLNFTVYEAKGPNNYTKAAPVVNNIRDSVFKANIQFDRPFGHSTATWGGFGEHCARQTHNIKCVQPHYHGNGQSVTVTVDNTNKTYVYTLKSKNLDSSFLHFTASGKSSLFNSYFRHLGAPILHTDRSLHTNLTFIADELTWQIVISGIFSGCPAYLGVMITEMTSLRRVFHHDLLVSCPTSFRMLVSIRTTQLPHLRTTFRVVLQDAASNHSIFLTHFINNMTRTMMNSHQNKTHNSDSNRNAVQMIYVVIAMTCLFVLIVAVVILLYLKCSDVGLSTSEVHETISDRASNVEDKRSQMSTTQRTVFITFIIVKSLYGLLFTFTAMFIIVYVCCHGDLMQLSRVGSFMCCDVRKAHSDAVQSDLMRELRRQLESVNNMRAACEYYVEDKFLTTATQMKTITMNNNVKELYHANMSLSSITKQNITLLLDHYLNEVGNFSKGYSTFVNKTVLPLHKAFRLQLQAIYSSPWLMFPLSIFNSTRWQASSLDAALEFARFLQLTGVYFSTEWMTSFQNSYDHQVTALLPNVSSLDNISEYVLSKMADTHLISRFHDDITHIVIISSNHSTDVFNDAWCDVQREDILDVLTWCQIGFLIALLVVLDMLLLWYRCHRLYFTANSLHTALSKPAHNDQLAGEQRFALLQVREDAVMRAEDALPLYKLLMTEISEAQLFKKATEENIDNTIEETDQMLRSAATPNNCCLPLCKSMQCPLVAGVVIVLALLVFSYFLADLALYCVDMLFSVEGLLYSVQLEKASNQSWFADHMATQYTQLMGAFYKRIVDGDLLQLNTFIDYFNTYQDHLAAKYISEVNSIRNTSSAISLQLDKLDVPLLPCNFLPVQSQFSIDYSSFEDNMSASLQPTVHSLCSLIVKLASITAILCSLAVMLSMLALLAFAYVCAGNVRRTYLMSIAQRECGLTHMMTHHHIEDVHEDIRHDTREDTHHDVCHGTLTSKSSMASSVNTCHLSELTWQGDQPYYSETKV